MPYSVESLLEIDEVVVEVLLVFDVLLYEETAVEDLLDSASLCSKARLLFCQQFFRLRLQSLQYDLEQDLAGVAYQAYGAVVLAFPGVAFLGKGYDQ